MKGRRHRRDHFLDGPRSPSLIARYAVGDCVRLQAPLWLLAYPKGRTPRRTSDASRPAFSWLQKSCPALSKVARGLSLPAVQATSPPDRTRYDTRFIEILLRNSFTVGLRVLLKVQFPFEPIKLRLPPSLVVRLHCGFCLVQSVQRLSFLPCLSVHIRDQRQIIRPEDPASCS